MLVIWNWRKHIASFLGSRCVSLAILGPVLLIGITISANEASAWTRTADFESGTPGQKAIGNSGFDSAGPLTVFSRDRARSGSQSAKMTWKRGSDGWETTKGYIKFEQTPVRVGQHIWSRAYWYFKSPWSWGAVDPSQGGVIKMTRFREMYIENGTTKYRYNSMIGRVSAIPYVSVTEGALQNGVSRSGTLEQNMNLPKTGLVPDRWYCLEMYHYFHPTQGIVRFWIDGVLKAEYTNMNTAKNDTGRYDHVLWASYWNGGAPQDQDQYIDDIVITTDTPATRDAYGNPMIGINPPVADTTPPATPRGLRVN